MPGELQDLTATPGDRQVALSWRAPVSDGGSAITRYEYRQRVDGASGWPAIWTDVGLTTQHTVGGLTNGEEYTFQVRAVNAVGAGEAASESATPMALCLLTVSGSSAVSYAENSSGSVATYTATASNCGSLTWTLGGTDASAFRLDGTGTTRTLYFNNSPNFESQSNYGVDLVVSEGTVADTVVVAATVTNVDEAGQVALTPATPQINQPVTAQLTDPDGSITGAEWSWYREGTTPDTWVLVWPEGAVGAAEAAELSSYTPDEEDVGHRLQARVSYRDGESADATDLKTAESAPSAAVIQPNRPPAFTNPDLTPSFAENGTGSVASYTVTDPDGDTLTWSLGGTDASACRLDGTGTTRDLHFITAPNFESQSSYAVEVIVSDGVVADTVAVAVSITNVDEAGTVTLSSLQPRVGETLRATLKDDDGQIVVDRWSWERFPQPFAEGASGLAVGEYTPSAGEVGQYVRVTVYYSDGHGADKQAQSAQTEAIVDVPGVPQGLTATPGDGQVALSWRAPVSDGGSAITRYEYRQRVDGESGWPTIWTDVGLTTQHTVGGLTNGEEYTFQVRAVNEVGAGDAAERSATPMAPCLLTVSGSSAVSYAENSTGSVATYTATASNCGSLTWTLGGTDASAFRLDGTGTTRNLYFTSSPNFETRSSYAVEVIVSEGTMSDTVAVAVSITNVDEAGSVTLSSTQPEVGTTLRATLSDPDGIVGTPQWSWLYFSSGAEGATEETVEADAVEGANGVFSTTFTPSNVLVGLRLRARALYTDGEGSNKSAASVKTDPVIDVPEVPSLSATGGDRQVTLRWSAPDDNGSPIQYYQYRHSGGSWATVSGGVSARSQTVSNLSNGTTYTFEVRAVNAVGAGDAARASATTVQPNRAPTVTGPSAVSVAEGRTAVADYDATDPDGDAITWSKSGTHASSFSLSRSGTLTFSSAPNFESGPTTYTVTVSATDSGGLSDAKTVTVTITNVDEAGSISISPDPPQAGERVTATLTDPDGSIRSVSWSWTYFSASGTAEATETAEASDSEGAAASQTRTITISRTRAGYRIQFSASYTDGHGSGKQAQSARSSPITAPAPTDTPGSVSLSTTTPQAGQSITATLSDPDTPISIQGWTWFSASASAAEGEAEIVEEQDAEGANGSLSRTRTISTALVGKRLRARVSYTDAFGSQTATSAYTSPVAARPPGPPRNLEAVAQGYTQVLLTWDAPSSNGGANITGYQYRRTEGSRWTSWSSAGDGSQTVSGLSGGTQYTFAVRAVNSAGAGSAATVSGATRASDESEGEGETPAEGEQDEEAPDEEAPEEEDLADEEEAPEEEAPAAKRIGSAVQPDAVLAALAAPNPFNPTTTLHVQLPASGPVRLTIYNVTGQGIYTLVNQSLEAGYHTFHWDGRDEQGFPVTSGVYLYRLRTNEQSLVGKMALIR